MRTPEEQEHCLQSDRFKPSTSQSWRRVGKGIWRTLLCLAILEALFPLYLYVRSLFTRAVITGQKTPAEFLQYGFSIQQPRLRTLLSEGPPVGMTVKFWTKSAGRKLNEVDQEFPRIQLFEVKQHRWLAGNKAILLDMNVAADFGSYAEPEEHWTLYNFSSNDLKTCDVWGNHSCVDLQNYADHLH